MNLACISDTIYSIYNHDSFHINNGIHDLNPQTVVLPMYNSDIFWNHTWQGAQWRACFMKNYKICSEDWREIFMKQPVNKYR